MNGKWFLGDGVSPTQKLVRGLAAVAVAGLVAVSAAAAVTSRVTAAPANSSMPTISGTAATGSTVTANPGTWTGSTPITYQYQWEVCGAVGEACHAISGATSSTYAIKSDGLGNTLRIAVLASNSDGSSAAISSPTARIVEGTSTPANASAPTISGSPNVGSTLTANPGSWTGSAPITFKYQWEICGANGDACHDIAGAATQTYQVKTADPGNTVRVRVTGSNSAGSNSATSAATARIAATAAAPQPAANGCPQAAAGATAVAVAAVTSPARLQIASFQPNPTVLTRSTGYFTVRFRVTDTCGQAVQGAQVYATAVPFGQATIPAQLPTDANGYATMQFKRLSGFPAARNQQLMVMFVRATKPGDPALAGISTRRLISLRVNLHA